MTNSFHTEIKDSWKNLTLIEQMANIGAEVGRAIKWKNKNKTEISLNAFYRGLELIDLTTKDVKNRSSLKEILRVRELFVDYIIGKNIYNSSDLLWDKYFLFYNCAARKDK